MEVSRFALWSWLHIHEYMSDVLISCLLITVGLFDGSVHNKHLLVLNWDKPVPKRGTSIVYLYLDRLHINKCIKKSNFEYDCVLQNMDTKCFSSPLAISTISFSLYKVLGSIPLPLALCDDKSSRPLEEGVCATGWIKHPQGLHWGSAIALWTLCQARVHGFDVEESGKPRGAAFVSWRHPVYTVIGAVS